LLLHLDLVSEFRFVLHDVPEELGSFLLWVELDPVRVGSVIFSIWLGTNRLLVWLASMMGTA